MEQQHFCQIQDHEQEEKMYICNELQCIDLKDNQLLCQKCLCNHKGVNYNKLKQNAINKYNEYKQILKNEIEDSEEFKKNVDDQFQKIKEEMVKILNCLQKKIESFVDNQSVKLNTNQNNAQQLMQDPNPSLDMLIYFALFSNTKLQQKLSQTKLQMKKIINDIIEDINYKIIDYLDQPDINKYKIIEIEQQSFQIESIFQQKLPYGYCNQHFIQKSSICTHKECLQQNNVDYYCLRCSKTTHAQHFQNDHIEEYDKLKQMQKAKQTLQENEIKKVKESAQKLINDQIQKLKSQQKEQYMNYVVTIENIKHLDLQFQINLSIQDTKYIFGDLLQSLITIKDEEIQSQFNNEYRKLEEQLKNCKIQDEQQFKEICNLIESNSNKIHHLQIENEELKQLVNTKDEQLQNASNQNLIEQFRLLKVSIEEFKQTTNKAQENQQKSLTANIGELKQLVNTKDQQLQNAYNQNLIEQFRLLKVCIEEFKLTTRTAQQTQQNSLIANIGELKQIVNTTKDNFNQKTNQIQQQQSEHQQKTEQIGTLLNQIRERCETYFQRNPRNNNSNDCQIF